MSHETRIAVLEERMQKMEQSTRYWTLGLQTVQNDLMWLKIRLEKRERRLITKALYRISKLTQRVKEIEGAMKP